MFAVSVDSADVLKRLDAMAEGIGSLQEMVPEEFLEWQRDDMKRSFPTATPQAGGWATVIYPRSRLTRPRAPGQKPGPKPGQRRIAAPTVVRKGVVVHSARPILRPELFEQLIDRMSALLASVCGKK
jgi:hypothetical protein